MDPAQIAADVFPHTSREFSFGDHAMRYVDTRPDGSAASTVLCVHGNPTWSFYYRRVIDDLGGGVRVVAPDHLGCGRSDKPSAGRADYHLAAHRDRLMALIEKLDLTNVVLLAHDWGGAIGLDAMRRLPDRLAAIVLLNTAAFPPPYLPRRIAACRIPVFGTLAMRGAGLFEKAATRMTVNRRPLSRQTRRGLLAPYGSWADRVAIDRFVHDIPMKPSHPTFKVLRELESALPGLANRPDGSPRPIRLVWGMKDWCFRPECLERFEAIWPDATVTQLDDVGHYVMEDAPEEVLETLRSVLPPR